LNSQQVGQAIRSIFLSYLNIALFIGLFTHNEFFKILRFTPDKHIFNIIGHEFVNIIIIHLAGGIRLHTLFRIVEAPLDKGEKMYLLALLNKPCEDIAADLGRHHTDLTSHAPQTLIVSIEGNLSEFEKYAGPTIFKDFYLGPQYELFHPVFLLDLVKLVPYFFRVLSHEYDLVQGYSPLEKLFENLHGLIISFALLFLNLVASSFSEEHKCILKFVFQIDLKSLSPHHLTSELKIHFACSPVFCSGYRIIILQNLIILLQISQNSL
jgi:hypothetical protein